MDGKARVNALKWCDDMKFDRFHALTLVISTIDTACDRMPLGADMGDIRASKIMRYIPLSQGPQI